MTKWLLILAEDYSPVKNSNFRHVKIKNGTLGHDHKWPKFFSSKLVCSCYFYACDPERKES